jgi:toxin CcdB
MAQFDVYKNLDENSNENVPYLLDVQNDILNHFNTRVVIPLFLNMEILKGLNTKLIVNDNEYILATADIVTIPYSILGDKVTNLEDQRTEILNAIDFLITGF